METRWPASTLVDALRQAFDLYGGPSACSDVVVTAQRSEILMAFSWMRDVHRFAVRFPLDDLGEGMQTGEPLESPADWVREVMGWLHEDLPGYPGRASRNLVDGRIELSRPMWPNDERCYLSGALPGSAVWQGRLRSVARDGLTSRAVEDAAASGRLISWTTSSLNTMAGGPIVGQAVVVRVDERTAELTVCEALAGAPDSIVFDLARTSLTSSAGAGVETVVSAIELPGPEILGFHRRPGGELVADTGLLDADQAKARVFIAQAQLQPIPAEWVRRAAALPVSRVYAGPWPPIEGQDVPD